MAKPIYTHGCKDAFIMDANAGTVAYLALRKSFIIIAESGPMENNGKARLAIRAPAMPQRSMRM